MAKASPIGQLIPIPFPFAGIDTDSAFENQRKGTTPFCVNVRPWNAKTNRGQGSRRPGMRKFVSKIIEAGSIQSLDLVIVPLTSVVGTEDTLTVAGSTTTVKVYGQAAAAIATTDPTTITLSNASNVGTYDEDNNAFTAALNSTTLQVKKIGTDYQVKWTSTATVPSSSLAGIAASLGVVYVYVQSASIGHIYRFDAADGTQLDSGPWLSQGQGIPIVWASTTPTVRNLAAGGGVVCVVGSVSSVFVAVLIDADTGVQMSSTALASSSLTTYIPLASQSNIYGITAVNFGTSFYIGLKGDDTGADTAIALLAIVSTPVAGAISFSFTSGTNGEILRDIAYDNATFSIGIVGVNLFGTTNSFQQRDGTTGVVVRGGQPLNAVLPSVGAAVTDYAGVAAAGDGTFRLRQNVGANQILKLSPSAGAVNTWTTWVADPGVAQSWIASTQASTTPPDIMMPSRFSRALCIVNGNLWRFDTGTPGNIHNDFVDDVAFCFGTQVGLLMVYGDGATYATYNVSTNVCGTLTASAGSLPADQNGEKCRILETWRGRLCMSGLRTDAQNWFFSRVDDATDWDYAPTTTDTKEAIAGNVARAGMFGDPCTGLVPCSDDIMLVGGDHSISRFTGDPAAGGSIDNISYVTGMAFGRAWCLDPQGTVYFFGSRGGVYRCPKPYAQVQKISSQVDDALFDIDLSTHLVRMAWDERYKGCHIWATPFDATEPTTNYWCQQTGQRASPFAPQEPPASWWPDVFGNVSHNPLAVLVYDGDAPGDRTILMGGRDGYIRTFDEDATSDDGKKIVSSVLFGPITAGGMAFRMLDLQTIMYSGSGSVDFSIQRGESVEVALNGDSVFDGTFGPNRNYSQPINIEAHAIFISAGSSAVAPIWSFESMRGIIKPLPLGPAQRSWA